LKLTLSIPYKQRLHNLRVVFEGLVNQTMDPSEFEVLVAAMEYSHEYLDLCLEFADRINIVSVVTSYEFQIPRARNMAMRQAVGEVIVQMDADTLLPPEALSTLYDSHFAFGQSVCAVGQVVGYGNNMDGDVTGVEDLPYAHHSAALSELVAGPTWPADPRFRVPHVIPWAFGWTGLIALRADSVREHGLFFDEKNFHGWGVDDLEWSYRVCAAGIPLVLCPDVYALHLPHIRDSAANRQKEVANYRRFLQKWPRSDVELSFAFGDLAANGLYLEYRRELRAAAGGATLGTVRGSIDGQHVVMLGVELDPSGARPEALAVFDRGFEVEQLPLAGLALPYDDHAMDECRVLPSIASLSARYRDVIYGEAGRVAKRVIHVGEEADAVD
jgi:glycosyltransferase involved in cell wall biosynthesis